MTDPLLKIIRKDNPIEWNSLVKTFKNWDIYYLFEYAYSLYLHGDGEPLLVYYQDDNCKFCYVVMQSDIAQSELFSSFLDSNRFFDWSTPYGYGGPLTDECIPENSAINFLSKLKEYCLSHKVISQFVRFHPLLKNYDCLPSVIESKYLRDTIYIDTSSKEIIWKNLDSKNRNMVRKAQKNGITVLRKPIADFKEFMPLYLETMDRKQADKYYIFSQNYFESLKSLDDNACIFYALCDNKYVGGAIVFFNEKTMHYHLAGTKLEYRKFAVSNLILYEAALWANKMGIKKFHLGGGMSPNDSLFGFKKQFNKTDSLKFVVGRTIFDKQSYTLLLNIRIENDKMFNPNNHFMIQYRG